ncbi:MAG: sensor histidine kinase [Candidatus Dormibacteria bacterium]
MDPGYDQRAREPVLSLRARLSALSVALLLLLLVLGGLASYLALGTYQRINEAQSLDRRYDVTLREFRASAGGAVRPGVAACAANRLGGRSSVLGGGLSVGFAQECLAPAFAGPQVTALIVAPDGAVLACATAASTGNSCDPASAGIPILTAGQYVAAARGAPRAYYRVGTGSDERLVVSRRFPASGRVLAVVQLSESTATLQQTQRALLGVLGVAGAALALLAVAVTPLLVGRALRPLRRVTDASTALAAGDLDRRVDVPATHDEVGQLARAFNDMASAIQRALHVREESESGMRTFVSDASHELRTPLTTLQGQLDVLARGAAGSPGALENSLASMRREVTRMSALVEDLLTLTRLDSPGARRQRTIVDLDRLVAETVDEQSVRFPDQHVEVEAASPGLLLVEGDREELRRLVLNLATNAAKYAPGGVHRWRTARIGERAIMTLTDEGPGISPEAISRVFDRFYRGPAEAGRVPGSGLGLAIVRSVAEAHGGSVAVSSTPEGTRFQVELPATAP